MQWGLVSGVSPLRLRPPTQVSEGAAVPDGGDAACQNSPLHGRRLQGGRLGEGEEGAGAVEVHGGHDLPHQVERARARWLRWAAL